MREKVMKIQSSVKHMLQKESDVTDVIYQHPSWGILASFCTTQGSPNALSILIYSQDLNQCSAS